MEIPIIQIIVVIAVVGLLVWAVQTLIPMPAKFQQAIYVLAVVFLCMWLLQVTGLLSAGTIRIR